MSHSPGRTKERWSSR